MSSHLDGEGGRRVNCEVDSNLFNDLKQYIPWGLQSQVMIGLFKAFVKFAKTNGNASVAYVINGDIEITAVHKMNTTDEEN